MVSLEKEKSRGKGVDGYYGLLLIYLLFLRRAVNTGIDKLERKWRKIVPAT